MIENLIIPEPYITISDHEVHDIIKKYSEEYLGYMTDIITKISTGTYTVDMPSKKVFTDGNGGDFRVMPCVFKNEADIFKTVKVVGTNVTNKVVKNQICVGKAFVLHSDDNYITHIVDACILSAIRTAAFAIFCTKLASVSSIVISVDSTNLLIANI